MSDKIQLKILGSEGLKVQINGGITTFRGLSDTPDEYTGEAGKFVKVNDDEDGLEFSDTDSAISWGEIIGTLSDQTDLQAALDLKTDETDFLSHTGDATIHFTEASINHTAIQNIGTNSHVQIDSHIADTTIHFTEATIDHVNILNIGTNTHSEIDTHISNTSNPHAVSLEQARNQNNQLSGNIDMNSNNIINLGDPTNLKDAVTKEYVDSAIQGLEWQDSVISFVDFTSAEPGSPNTGDRYINTTTGLSSGTSQSVTANYIYEWDGSVWQETIVSEGFACWVDTEDTAYVFNGTNWIKFGSTITHNNLSGLQGGTSNEYYHLTSAQHTDLTDGNDSSLHFHSADRNRANHTGTQLSSTISDFDEASQDSVGNILVDSSTIDFTYNDGVPSITADVIQGGISHDNLISGTIASHDTTATGTQLNTLTDNSIADLLHRHSELVASDGTPDPALSVDASGNVGIGTASPQEKLHIQGTGAQRLEIETDDENSPVLKFTRNNLNSKGIFLANDLAGGTRLDFFDFDASAVRMAIDDAGNVGIGTISPLYHLDIQGGDHQALRIHRDIASADSSVQFAFALDDSGGAVSNYAVIDGGITTNTADSEDGFLRILTSNAGVMAEKVRVDKDGNVGIGTTSPGNKLDIVTGATTNSEFHLGEVIDEGLYIRSDADSVGFISTGAELVAGNWVARSTTATIFGGIVGEFQVFTDSGLTDGNVFGASQRFTIKPDGNVGIGIDEPLSILDVRQLSDGSDATIRLTNTAGSGSTDETSVLRFGHLISSEFGGDLRSVRIEDYSSEANRSADLRLRTIKDGSSVDVINFKDVGDVEIVGGDLFFTGTGTGLPYGNCYQTGGSTFTTTLTDQNTWYELNAATTNINAGELNAVTFPDDHYLLVEKAGRYSIDYSVEAEINSVAGGSQHIEADIMINGNIVAPGRTHHTFVASSTDHEFTGFAILDLAANDQISIGMQNTSSTGKVMTIDHFNLRVLHIGGT